MKKYILAEGHFDHPAGTELEINPTDFSYCSPDIENKTAIQFSQEQIQRAIEQGWVKEVDYSRVKLLSSELHREAMLYKESVVQFTPEEIALMERALNGELMEKVDLREFAKWFIKTPESEATIKDNHAKLLEAFNNREK